MGLVKWTDVRVAQSETMPSSRGESRWTSGACVQPICYELPRPLGKTLALTRAPSLPRATSRFRVPKGAPCSLLTEPLGHRVRKALAEAPEQAIHSLRGWSQGWNIAALRTVHSDF